MNKNIKRIILLVLIIGWMVLIFSLSAQTATQSAELSGGIINKILNLFDRELSEFEVAVIDFMQFIIRKSAHMFLYVVLAVLVRLELLTYDTKKDAFLSAGICICYAISDEVHQYFVPGRSCELRDILIDTIGVIIGVILIKIYRKLVNKYKEITIDKSI